MSNEWNYSRRLTLEELHATKSNIFHSAHSPSVQWSVLTGSIGVTQQLNKPLPYYLHLLTDASILYCMPSYIDYFPAAQDLKAELDSTTTSEESCPVCGDKVSGYHYGLLTCESCKVKSMCCNLVRVNHSICNKNNASVYQVCPITCKWIVPVTLQGFFKRSVQNNKNYNCAEQQSCPMNLSQRKRCPFCRFQKCLAVGMKREGKVKKTIPVLKQKHTDAGMCSDVRLLPSTAVRADRMRGGRNKFGPLYRRDRQMKQQKVFFQTNTDPHMMKAEMTQTQRPTTPNDLHLMSGHTSSDAGRQPSYTSGTVQSVVSMPLDCTVSSDVVFTPPSLPYPGLYHRTFPGYLQDKGEIPYSYSMAAPVYPLHQSPNNSYAYRSTPPSSSTSSPSSTPSSSAPVPKTSAQSPDACSSSTATQNLLSQLLEGEQDESQLCAKVVASLQREQANRGKHDRLNTFSIMCKMADQTLFGLVEWARNSTLFKELKVI